MTKGQKTALFILLGILLSLGIGWVVLKSTLGKLINSEETRTEITRLLEENLGVFVPRPKVTISSLNLSGLSEVEIGTTYISSFGTPILTATGSAQCNPIKLFILRKCTGQLNLDFGEDGRISLRAMIPKKLIFGTHEKVSLRASGRLEEIAVDKLLGESRKSTRKFLEIKGGKLSGDLTVNISITDAATLSGNLVGAFKQVELTASIAGQSRRLVKDIPVELAFDNKRLFFAKPLLLAMFGLSIQYAGEIRLAREAEWNGKVSARGQPLALNYLPSVFRCKGKPRSPAAFRVRGPVSGPECG